MALSDVHDFLAFAHFLPILMGTFFAIRMFPNRYFPLRELREGKKKMTLKLVWFEVCYNDVIYKFWVSRYHPGRWRQFNLGAKY